MSPHGHVHSHSATATSGLAGWGMAGAAAVLLLGWTLIASAGVIGRALAPSASQGAEPVQAGVAPVADIPPAYLRLYIAAAARYGLDWTVLAGIGKVECDHGRDPDPSCTRVGAVNAAGAGGPAQFLASTWREYGVDGNGDGLIDRWNPADAVFSMANYLRASGAPQDYPRALFAYNHSWSYVKLVLHWASVYRAAAANAVGAGAGGPGVAAGSHGAVVGSGAGAAGSGAPADWAGVGPVLFVPGSSAVLSPNDGHLALVPEQAPPAVQAMVLAGNELQDLPYGPAGHPDPRNATSEDCSSTVNFVLYRSGVRPIGEIVRDNPLAQDYTRWGDPGPGRWVSIYATTAPTDHVFMVIAGLRLDTSHDGTDVGPNRLQDGPRWRVLDHIPTWAHWMVRHPPGL